MFQVSSEYADCLEKAFRIGESSVPVAASEGAEVSPTRRDTWGRILGAKGNTPLESRHIGEISEDTVHLSVWAEWGVHREELFHRLHRAQQDARGYAERVEPTDEPEELMELDFDPAELVFDDAMASPAPGSGGHYMEAAGNNWFEFGGQLWRVKAHGVGGKDGRSYYPYAIKAGGVLIAFRRDKHETVSNMWIEIGSIPLAQNDGLSGMWKQLCSMFSQEGVHIEKTIVSRVDVYADFDDVDVSSFCARFNENCRVTRARRLGTYSEEMNTASYYMGNRQTGFSIGTQIKLRCYDKRYELRNDPVKWGIFAERYNGLPDVLTRIEFQLRRVALKEFLVNGRDRIEGVESYLSAREQLWLYLTEDWFRLTESKVDKKNRHQDRAKTWSVWERVQKAVVGVVKEIFRHAREPRIDMEALYKQALGCVCKMAVYEHGGNQLETVQAVLRHFWQKIVAHGEAAFWEAMNRHYDDMHERLGFSPLPVCDGDASRERRILV